MRSLALASSVFFFVEFLFERVELAALAGDHRVGDFALGLEIAVEVGVFLLHDLEVRFKRGDAGHGLGVRAAALGEGHGHGFAFLFEGLDAVVE